MKSCCEHTPVINFGRIMQSRRLFNRQIFVGLARPTMKATGDKRGNPAITALLLTAGLVLLLAVAWIGRLILLLFFAAIVVAILLTSIVDWVVAKLRLGRKLAFSLILVAITFIVSLALWISGPNIVEQFANLQSDLPQAIQQSVERIRGYGWGRWALAHWSNYSQLPGNFSYALTSVGGIVLSAASLFAGLLIIGFLGLYLAAEPDAYFSGIRRITPARYREFLDACASSVVQVLRSWILARMLSMVAVGILVTLGLWALGVPLAVSLGIIAALMTFIPNVGPILSVVPAALLAFAISPGKGLLTILLFALVHFLEGNIITPLIQRSVVRLPPAITLTAQLLLAVVAGPLGFALAAPLTAATLGVFQVLFPPETDPPNII